MKDITQPLDEVLNVLEPFKEHIHEIKDNPFDYFQIIFKFMNNYGLSIINTSISHGLEAGVIKFEDNNNWKLDYVNPVINEDTIGYLKKEDLIDLINKVKSLNEKGELVNE